MIKSINQPWSISDKHRAKYGKTWADLDFIVNDKISEENFKTDPMNCEIGELHVHGYNIKLTYKDIINYAKQIDIYSHSMYAEGFSKTDLIVISIKQFEFTMAKHEVARLSETLAETMSAVAKSYELGLYL